MAQWEKQTSQSFAPVVDHQNVRAKGSLPDLRPFRGLTASVQSRKAFESETKSGRLFRGGPIGRFPAHLSLIRASEQ